MASSLAEEDLVCPICLGIFQEPHMLGCGHNFCLSCVKSRVPYGLDAGSCPECRRPFELQELASNRALGNLARKVRRLQLDRESLLEGAHNFCEEHQEPLKLFCCHDRVPICVICRDLPCHRGHEFLPTRNAVEYAQGKLEPHLKSLEEKLKEAADDESFQLKEMSELESCTEDTLSHISGEFEALHQILHEKERSFKKTVKEMREKNLEEMQDALTVLKDEISSYTEIIARIKAALEVADHMAFLKDFKELMDKIGELQDDVGLIGKRGENGEEEAGNDEEEDKEDGYEYKEDSGAFVSDRVVPVDVALKEFKASLDFELGRKCCNRSGPGNDPTLHCGSEPRGGAPALDFMAKWPPGVYTKLTLGL